MIQNLSKCLNPFKYQNFFHKLNISQIHKCAIITFALFDYCQSQKVLLCSYQLCLSKISSMPPINFSHHVHFFLSGPLAVFPLRPQFFLPGLSRSSWLFGFCFLQGSVGSSFSFSCTCSPFHRLSARAREGMPDEDSSWLVVFELSVPVS